MEEQNYAEGAEYYKSINFIKEQLIGWMERETEIREKLIAMKHERESWKKKKEEAELLRNQSNPNYQLFTAIKKSEEIALIERAKTRLEELNRQIPIYETIYQDVEAKLEGFQSLKALLEEKLKPVEESALPYSVDVEDINKQKRKELNEMGMGILKVQEVERNRIARDLHDSTIQNMASLVHKIEIASKLMDQDIIRSKLELAAVIRQIKGIIEEMRSIIYDLRPMAINDLGLTTAIRQLLDKLKRVTDMQIVFQVEHEENAKKNSIVNLTLYRIVQEACNNCIKHAGASELIVHISYMKRGLELDIIDNGKGFDWTSKVKENEIAWEENNEDELHPNGVQFGLSIMEERVYLLCGKIKIESKPNKGTEIHIRVPLQNKKEDASNESS